MRPGIGGIAIGRIVEKPLPAVFAMRDEIGLGPIEQRALKRDVSAHIHRNHPGKTSEAASAQQTKQDRLRLVIGMVSRNQMGGANFRSIATEQCIARIPGAFLDSGFWLVAFP